MQNINILFFLTPIIVIIISSALVIYWYRKRHFRWTVLIFSLVAYAGAIALKYAVQIPTINLVRDSGPFVLGAYYGIQTMVFEVGLAFLVALIAIRYSELNGKDGEGYASGLAFWENAGLLGILLLINYVTYYSVLSSDTPLAQQLYDQLLTNSPGLFSSNQEALALIAIGVFERISSIIVHFAWGYLCFMAAYHHKLRLFFIALPMGLIDFFVPFAASSPLLFEGVFFGFAVTSLIVAWYVTKNLRKHEIEKAEPTI
ncbi:MAG: YhfC family glutamic-type intramembrane protease [Candidatus Bathyarchaeia archaeon]|jgi:hypothetical protein